MAASLSTNFAIITANKPPPRLSLLHASTSSLRLLPIRHQFGRASTRARPSRFVCMANPRRVKMVAKQIQREISQMLLTDKVLQCAVLPESSLGADRYLSSLTTVSDVEVSGDLQVVKVYVSVFGDERGKETAIAGLKAKTKYVRQQLGRRMKLRVTPEVRFIENEAIERGSRVIAILDKLKEEQEQSVSSEDDASDEKDLLDDPSDDERWEEEEEEDDDDGIIYVK